MRNKIRKGISILATFCMAIMLLAGMGPVEAKADSVSWNFKNSGFKDLGTISSSVTVDGLTLIATSSKTMSVKTDSQTVDGTSYTHALALGGTGSTSYRAVKVPVSGSDTIKVTLRSSGSSSRTLVVADASGNKLGTITAGTSAALGTYSYSGSAGYVYLYSAGSGINIYKIQVDSAGSSSSSSSGSSSSSSSSSGSSSSSTTTTTASSTSWNFKNSGFNSLGTISSSVTVDGLTLIATSSKTMSVTSDSQTVDGTSYTHALALGGGGSTSYRAVKVPVSGTDTIKVVLRSSGTSARTLVVADASGKQLGTISAPASAALGTYSYSGSDGYVYLYSSGSGINIYKIQVDSTGSSSGSSSSGSSSSGSSSSGSSSSSTTVSNYSTLSDGWYYIKNVNSQKYLQVANNSGYDGANVEQGTGSGVSGQKWYLTNVGSGYFTLKNGTGYMLDIPNGENADGTNVQVWSANGYAPQNFKAVASSKSGAYGILTNASYDTKSLDVYNFSTSDGGNICQWTYYDNTCQQWIFEAIGGSSSSGSSSSGSSSSGSSSSGSSSSSTDTSDGTVVTSFSSLVSAIDKAESNGGGKVYVKGTTISCTGQIALSTSNSNVQIIGVQNSDGTYPVLDFSSFLDSYIGKSTSDSGAGIRITGSKYTIKNLIIEKTPDNGIQIKGSSAGNNTVSNCIVRYCNDAGLQITQGAYSNTIEYVCSYRNCDVYTLGGNADGFAPKLAAGKGNTFYACYAWDNSDDGWDSYDKTDGLTYDLSYEWCACWNNGNPDVFTGQYDFENGDSLDTNMLLVQLIMEKDSSFASNYKNGKFSLPTSKFIVTEEGTIAPSSWTGDLNGGNPNGFKVGSVNTTSSCTRTMKYCLAFDHAKKGFDNNNSAVTAYMSNCVAYDNGYNYYISPFTLKTFSNIVSFSGSSSDKLPSGYSISSISSSKQSSIRSTVESTKDSIIASCYANKIPGAVYFDIFD